MKITVLMENTTKRLDMKAEHGLSLYIETKEHRLLFDMGQSDAFAENAKVLGIDLSKVDMAVLSHGHYDHGGGLKKFLSINKDADVYLTDTAFAPHFSTGHQNPEPRYIGLDKELAGNPRLIAVPDEYVIDEQLKLMTFNNGKRTYATDSYGLKMRCREQFVPDDFRHEQYLVIHENGKEIVISGCSHKGILNIMSWVQPDVLIGGFHFMKLDPETQEGRQVLDHAAKTLGGYQSRYYTCHCTGMMQYEYLKQSLGTQLEFLGAGDVLEID